jgi:curved DNA-binding protein CbpA
MRRDHYRVLGVPPDAAPSEIRTAYLRLMRTHHPDRRPGDAGAETTARQANAAWTVLGDAARRRRYDEALAASESRPERPTVLARPHDAETLRASAAANAAYSADGTDYRRAFHRACLRVGLAAVALGTLLLLALS